jgi:pimeloyl-ACP methyl ester carboxylesterase
MSAIKVSEQVNHDRRRFLRNAAMTFAAAEFATIGSADAQSSKTNPAKVPPIKPGTNTRPLSPQAELGWWYQYYFDDATFDRTAESFNNPDHVSIVIHNYRWRLSLAKGEPRYDDLEQKLFEGPVIAVPAITITSDFDGPTADGTSYAKLFSRKYSHRILDGIAHNVPQEAPQAFAQAVVDVDGY